MKMVSSPKAFPASRRASSNAFSNSSTLRITRIPRPPPPALAFNITGKPIRKDSDLASLTDVSGI